MSKTAPHYLLLSDTQNDKSGLTGGWSFVLERINGSGRIEVADREPDIRGERLQLLAVIRGLEAIEQPSKVTLITPSRVVGRGIRNGLTAWRENNWQWERFGVMTEVKNSDLWQRIDRAKKIHNIDCRVWNFNRYLKHLHPNPVGKNKLTSAEPRIRSYSHKPSRTFNVPSWTEIATALANRIIPVQSQKMYGCA